jgi:hypothetical protein
LRPRLIRALSFFPLAFALALAFAILALF